ncbi:transglycosylase domain-containing protein [Streptomyces verrucosisporus]|uniref:transglycosylase domain-containing protein n=1 Tax=Streptomyces verrucosisporus TaxID=1695161 RepID=UPI0019D19257|nr:transglycosylase domain-containing protein [Streptomyces verrucosisporus]MBN3932467.1 transglycosylase domain-containing protein [Streptomyces verrucosisporus]
MPNKRSGGGLSGTQQAAKFLGVSVLSGAVLAGIALPVAGGLGLAAKGTVESFDEIPMDFKRPPLSQKNRILDSEGNLIATDYYRDRTVVPLKKISPTMRKAIVAIEDSRFYEHGAIDLKSVMRALNRNAQQGGVAEGGSTLTQQYVKNVFVEQAGDDQEKVAEATQQTIGRKIQELKYAIRIEEELSKEQILENYLNITFFGQQAYGIEAAARRYFSKNAADLELHEAALLAGLVQSPTYYDPVNYPDRAVKRRNIVLNRMAETGAAGKADVAAAKKKDLGLKVSKPRSGCITSVDRAGFFCDYVRKVILSDPVFGKTEEERKDLWKRGGLTVRTTLSPKAQKASADAATSMVYEDDPVATAVVQVEPGTGRILSMAQSRPYGLDQNKNQTLLNLSVDNDMGGSTSGFQVGSTFKPIVAAAAMAEGISPASTYKSDWKTSFKEGEFTVCGNKPYGSKEWSVQNELESEKGTWDMTGALSKSINTYFVDLGQKVGLCDIVKMAEKMGVKRGDGESLEQRPAMILGGQNSSPLTMAAAYATFANRGTYCSPVAIEKITDADGKKLPVPRTKCERAMSEHIADSVNKMLKGVVEDGTGTRAGLTDRDNAGKTGTTDGRKDAWFVGYTPNLSTAVWVGDDVGTPMEMYDLTIGGRYYGKVCGGCLPGPIWKTAMRGALKGEPVESFNDVRVPRADTDDKKDRDRGGDDDKPGDRRPGNPFPDISLPPGIIGGGGNGGPGGGGGASTMGGTTDGATVGTTVGGVTGGETGGDSIGATSTTGGWDAGGGNGTNGTNSNGGWQTSGQDGGWSPR